MLLIAMTGLSSFEGQKIIVNIKNYTGMKKIFFSRLVLPLMTALLLISACKKDLSRDSGLTKGMAEVSSRGHLKQVKTYSSQVLQEWINFDLRLLRTNPTLLNNFVMMQHWAYSSIALYESVLPGMPDNRSLSGQLNQMPAMPASVSGQAYHWPTVTNTVMAQMKRYYYPNLPAADKVSTDSLENALNSAYLSTVDTETFDVSVDFGKQVALTVYNWSLGDGSLTVHPAYVLPVGPGQWERTPTAFLAPQNPYWSTNRPLVPGLLTAAQLDAPPSYSTNSNSEFYLAAKEVYDLSQTLTNDQKAQVIAWRDVPGGGHAHWLSIFNQVLYEVGNEAMLDKAVEVYVKLGISQSDARIATWKAKYQYNLLRPVTYLRATMGYITWNSFITTPNHPEYPSAHSSFSVPAALLLTEAFGDNYAFTDHTYDFLGLAPRVYASFNDAAAEAGNSRVYGGLHYRFSISAGAALGTAVLDHMKANIMFIK